MNIDSPRNRVFTNIQKTNKEYKEFEKHHDSFKSVGSSIIDESRMNQRLTSNNDDIAELSPNLRKINQNHLRSNNL